MAFVWLAFGLGLLLLGAEALVRGGAGLARALGISPLLIGLTVVAYGTSTPELVISVDAAIQGRAGIAVGNIVGSNTINILVILGLTALLAPIKVAPEDTWRSAVFMAGAAALFVFIAATEETITRAWGAVLLVLMALTTAAGFWAERGHRGAAIESAEVPKAAPRAMTTQLILIAGGLALLFTGGNLFVDNAAAIARAAGVSETVIGLTLVALGSSLPELAASVIAALKRQPEIAVGNVIGSNIYNILAILGATAAIAPVSVDPALVRLDIWVMGGATLAILPALLLGTPLGRGYGFAMLFAYGVYLAFMLRQTGAF